MSAFLRSNPSPVLATETYVSLILDFLDIQSLDASYKVNKLFKKVVASEAMNSMTWRILYYGLSDHYEGIASSDQLPQSESIDYRAKARQLFYSKKYLLEPELSKSWIETQEYFYELSSGKTVYVIETNACRWGSAEIKLTASQRDELLLKEDGVNLTEYMSIHDHDFEFEEIDSSDVFYRYTTIADKDQFTADECDEICDLLEIDDINNDDSLEYEIIGNGDGWVYGDTSYAIEGSGVKLTQIEE